MILGIDLGKKTTGLAISAGELASPFATITHKSTAEAIEKITKICKEESVDKIVLGYVEGKIKSYFEGFAKKFKAKNPQIEIILQDETLTSRQAVRTMINIDMPKLKRQKKEHELAATIILENYLEGISGR